MRRRFLTALAASTLLMALCAPAALGQATATDEGDDVQYNGVCQNIIGSIGDITAGNLADANSTATSNATAGDSPADEGESTTGGGSPTAESQAEAVAEIAQETGLSIEQVNECLNGADGNDTDDNGKNEEDDDEGDKLREGEDAVKDGTVKADVLPNTGGPSLLAAGAGLALLAGGAALIRRR